MTLKLICLLFLCYSIALAEDFVEVDAKAAACGAPMTITLYDGQEFMFKLSCKPLTEMKACIIENYQTREKAQLKPKLENSPSIVGVSYWGARNDSHECGVRISNFNFNVSGMWSLQAVNGETILDRQIVNINTEESPHFEEKIRQTTFLTGGNGLLNFSTDSSGYEGLYCSITHPAGGTINLYGEDCTYEIPRSSSYDTGEWSASVGRNGLTEEFKYNMNVTVEDEKFISGWANSSRSYPGAVELFCALVNQTETRRFNYCHFIRPTDQVGFMLSDGIGNGKYSYSGSGIQNGDCRMTIEKPGAEDHGIWQCILGYGTSYNASLIPFYPNSNQAVRDVLAEPKQEPMNVINGSDVSLKCSTTAPLHYCYAVAPNGTQYYGEKSMLGIGTCLVNIKVVDKNHTGIWSCQMGLVSGGKECSEKINVIVRNTRMIALTEDKTAAVGAKVILRCQAVPEGSITVSSSPVRGSLSYCRFVRPNNASVTLSDQETALVERRFRYYGNGLKSGECGIQIDPVSVEDGGRWSCVGLLGGQDIESLAYVTLQVTESTEVFPTSALVEPGEEVFLSMKGRRVDQKSCSVEMPDGRVVDLSAPGKNPVSYWGTDIKNGDCGVKIESGALLEPTNGYKMWTLISNNSHLVSTRSVAWIAVQGSSRMRSSRKATSDQRLVVELGQNVTLDCSTENSVYCLIVPPGGNPDHYTPGPCKQTLEPVTSVHLGLWTCYIGLPSSTQEVEETVELVARDTTLSSSWGNTSTALNLVCKVDFPLQYCRFITPLGISYMVADGLINDRLSYKGQGLESGECGLSIPSPAADDYGVWMCFVGVISEGSIEHQVGYINIGKEKTRDSESRSSKNVMAVVGSELTVQCELSSSIAYCWLLHPNGTQIVPVPISKTNLQMGICSITLQEAKMEDAGQWTCHMGTLGSQEVETTIHVDIKGSSLYAEKSAIVVTGSNLTIACLTVPEGAVLDYCRFLRPDGKGFSLSQGMTGSVLDRYHYDGVGLDKGECGLFVQQIKPEDYGQWSCAALLHGTFKEASDRFTIQSQDAESMDNLIWIIPSGVGGVLAIVALCAVTVFFMKRRTSARHLEPSRPSPSRLSYASSTSSSSSQEVEVDQEHPAQQQEEPVEPAN